jgi:hypothetical protein
MTGKIHVELTGAITLSDDFDVESCNVYMPLDNAYVVNIAPNDVIDKSTLVVPQYKGPGDYTYVPETKPMYPNFDYRLIDLKLRTGPHLVETDGAQVKITVGEQGKTGSAVLKDYKTDDGGAVSGTVSWSCDAVEVVSV